jgi:hypothetical protein
MAGWHSAHLSKGKPHDSENASGSHRDMSYSGRFCRHQRLSAGQRCQRVRCPSRSVTFGPQVDSAEGIATLKAWPRPASCAQRTGVSWHPAPVSPRRMMGMRCSKPISGSKPRSIKPSQRDASVSRRSRPQCN